MQRELRYNYATRSHSCSKEVYAIRVAAAGLAIERFAELQGSQKRSMRATAKRSNTAHSRATAQISNEAYSTTTVETVDSSFTAAESLITSGRRMSHGTEHRQAQQSQK